MGLYMMFLIAISEGNKYFEYRGNASFCFSVGNLSKYCP